MDLTSFLIINFVFSFPVFDLLENQIYLFQIRSDFTLFSRSLSDSEQIDFLRKARTSIQHEKYEEAASLCSRLIDLALEGLSYYHTYDRFFLGTSVALSFVGWTSYVILVIIKAQAGLTRSTPSKHLQVLEQDVVLQSIDRAVEAIHNAAMENGEKRNLEQGDVLQKLIHHRKETVSRKSHSPSTQGMTPSSSNDHLDLARHTTRYPVIQALATSLLNIPWTHSVGFLFASTLGIEILVSSFFYRSMLSFGLITFSMWPLVSRLWTQAKATVLSWTLSCLLLSVFPLMPVVGRDQNIPLVTAAGLLILLSSSGLVAILWRSKKKHVHGKDLYLYLAQVSNFCNNSS
ncbi:UNVERIFIED_CONTAM: hypothetical protein K2H54_058650 [Gekko kuhli]